MYHTPASVFVGAVSLQYSQQIREVMGNRLRSQDKLKTAYTKWWRPHRLLHDYPMLIPPGQNTRGGEMASFALYMANSFQIKFGTITGYIQSIREIHTQCLGSVGDPLDGVLDWKKFMSALHVQSFVDATVESHVMVPFRVMVLVLLGLDRSCRDHIALACMILLMYYTMSRSETPLPKTKSSFDKHKHLRRDDVRFSPDLGEGVVEWAFGILKNSPRQTVADKVRTWKPVGACTGVLSMAYWLSLYSAASEWQDTSDPLFFDAESNPYTYAFMLRLFRTRISMLEGFTWETARIYGFHGLRVLGFNCARSASGEDVAVLHGGWSSDAYKTYSRTQLKLVLAAAQLGADFAARHALPSMPMDAVPVPASALPHDGPLVDTASPQASSTPAPEVLLQLQPSSDEVADLPVDAVRVIRKAAKRSYSVWRWRDVVYISRPRLRAAYATTKAFLLELRAFGYTHVAAPE